MAVAIRLEDLLARHPEQQQLFLKIRASCSRFMISVMRERETPLSPLLQPNPGGPDQIHEPALRKLTQIDSWNEQRHHFEVLFGTSKA
jgi:hypothetical protein